ncbi:MAG: hypothetical protein HOH95_06740 [Dehalococcoidia bacterium]|nr:hypothetical protein [Dehalococcoidia bacterium]
MKALVAILVGAALFVGCGEAERPVSSPLADAEAPSVVVYADVVAVEVSGEAGAYQFAVEVSSPDTGCDEYADWWEVVSEDGSELLYRRILAHSHVDEQPFVRGGGPVDIESDAVVVVRAHMNTGGFGGAALRGSVDGGFEVFTPELRFGAALGSVEPLPEGCAF